MSHLPVFESFHAYCHSRVDYMVKHVVSQWQHCPCDFFSLNTGDQINFCLIRVFVRMPGSWEQETHKQIKDISALNNRLPYTYM